jgi:hypothetical protein
MTNEDITIPREILRWFGRDVVQYSLEDIVGIPTYLYIKAPVTHAVFVERFPEFSSHYVYDELRQENRIWFRATRLLRDTWKELEHL